ncbi:MAG: hypothetical protein ACK416_05300 [Zestosphaera sp.]
MLKHATLMPALFMVLLVTSAPVLLAQEDVLAGVELLMRDLEYLSSRGVDVESVVDLLNKAIDEYVSGDVEKASAYLDEARKIVDVLKAGAESTYSAIVVAKTLTVVGLVLIPVIVYFMLPRLYLYLWFRLRRKWVVGW